MALWRNMHGAFAAGLMPIGCLLLAAAWRGWRDGHLFKNPQTWRLALCLAVGLLATLINPYGWEIYQYVRQTSSTSSARRIDEWGPPTLDLWISKAGLASLVIMAGWAFISVRRGRKPAAREGILNRRFLSLACGIVRIRAWGALACGA